jgi:hypothetical protein
LRENNGAEAALDGAPVRLDQQYWGNFERHWQVAADGQGEVWETPLHCKMGGEPPKDCFVSKYRLRLEGRPFLDFARAANELRMLTRDGIECRSSITDQSYGSVAWTIGSTEQRYHFDFGCLGGQADRALELIRRASDIVEKSAVREADPFEIEYPKGQQ